MAETNDIVASLRAWAPLVASGYTVPAAGQVMENAATALTDRDAQIERLRADKDAAERELKRILEAIEAKGGDEHAPTERAYQAACDAWRKRLDLHRAAEARATTAERDLAEARAEVERLKKAVLTVTGATAAYLPPGGTSASECISRVLGATDNPEINAIMLEKNNVRPQD